MKTVNLVLLATISAMFFFTACSANMPDDYYSNPYDNMGNNINRTNDTYNDYNYNYDKYDSRVKYNKDMILTPDYSDSISNNISNNTNNKILDDNSEVIYTTESPKVTKSRKIQNNINENYSELDKEILIDNTKTLNKTMNENNKVLTEDTLGSITTRESLNKAYSNNVE